MYHIIYNLLIDVSNISYGGGMMNTGEISSLLEEYNIKKIENNAKTSTSCGVSCV